MGGCGSGGWGDVLVCVFFFKRETAYELLRSLVGSLICVRDGCLCDQVLHCFGDLFNIRLFM